MSGKYDHIIGLPHHVSEKHPQMSNYDRAAQFSSFKALTGFEDEIDESARLTDCHEELTEDELNELNQAFQELLERTSERPLVTVTYFQPDKRKDGGEYVNYTGHFRFFEETERNLKFVEGKELFLDDVFHIEMK